MYLIVILLICVSVLDVSNSNTDNNGDNDDTADVCISIDVSNCHTANMCIRIRSI